MNPSWLKNHDVRRFIIIFAYGFVFQTRFCLTLHTIYMYGLHYTNAPIQHTYTIYFKHIFVYFQELSMVIWFAKVHTLSNVRLKKKKTDKGLNSANCIMFASFIPISFLLGQFGNLIYCD